MTEQIDYTKHIPKKLRDRPLFQKIVEVINNFTEIERVEFNDVLLKYRDPYSISTEGANEVIEEFGFGYITGMIEVLTQEEMGTLVSYIGFISLLKGSRNGLEVIFDLLKFKYEIIEWWEYSKDLKKGIADDSPELERYEWKMSIDILESPNFNNIFYTVPKIREFVRNYVYPVLAYLELVYRAELSPVGTGIYTAVDRTKRYEIGSDVYKVITSKCTLDRTIHSINEWFVDLDTDIFDDTLRLENDYNLLLENGDTIQLG